MPSPYDLLSQQLDTPTDPDDQLRLQMGQDQGANLVGGPQPGPDGMPQIPSPNVPGPLAALAPAGPAKPKIKLISKPAPKLRVKLKAKKSKPKIKLKTSALQNFLDSIGR